MMEYFFICDDRKFCVRVKGRIIELFEKRDKDKFLGLQIDKFEWDEWKKNDA